MNNIYEHAINTDTFCPHKEHLETEELINNFKFKYEELKIILDEKIKELHHTETAYKECITKFQYKFDELENVNYKLRTLLIEKQNENEELLRENSELHRRLGGDNDCYKGTFEKDRNIIEELNYKVRSLESILKERDETIHSLKSGINNISNDTWGDFRSTKPGGTVDYQKKYGLLKDKYMKLKNTIREKEEYLRVSHMTHHSLY
jgi:pyruvate-formate lyase-activating enzyme